MRQGQAAFSKIETWVCSPVGPLFAVLYVPRDDMARSGVVICPPLGKEHADTYRGVGLLAQELSERGLVALRFDYPGVGDSSGDQDDPDAVDRWIGSIAHAVAYLRSCGVANVSLVGLRAGALLAAQAYGNGLEVDSFVLWDPVESGARYLREQKARYQITQGPDDATSDKRVSILGAALHPDAARRFGELSVGESVGKGDPRSSLLLAIRPEHTTLRNAVVAHGRSDAEVLDIGDHDRFVRPSGFAVVIPSEDIRRIVEWIVSTAPQGATKVRVATNRKVSLGINAEGIELFEQIEHIGPHLLFAIRTLANVPGAPIGGPVVFFAESNKHRTGPGRVWVELARSLAVSNIQCLRFDRRDTGDSGLVAPAADTRAIYTAEAREDAIAVARSVGADSATATFAGLCSGSWNSAIAALEVQARAVVLVNTSVWTLGKPRRLSEILNPKVLGQGRRPAAVAPSGRTGVSLRGVVRRFLIIVRDRLPYLLWRQLGRLSLVQAPEVLLARLGSSGIQTTLVFAERDYRMFERAKGVTAMDRLRRKGIAPQLMVAEGGDHSMLQRDFREFARRRIEAVALGSAG